MGIKRKILMGIAIWFGLAVIACIFIALQPSEKKEPTPAVKQESKAEELPQPAFSKDNRLTEAEKLRNRVLLIKRDDAKIPEGRYFVDEIISCKVYHADTGELLGTLSDVSKTGANDVWHIKNGDKEYLVPAIESVVISVDIDAEKVLIRPMGGIFDAD